MGLLTRLFAATPENPRFSLNDPTAWDLFLDGKPASSGQRVNGEIALTHSPWWRGVNLLSSDVGKLPLFVYLRNGEGKSRDRQHPAYPLLRRKPNPFMVAFQFKKLLTSHAVNLGNGYAYIFRGPDMSPQELLPLDPGCTYPVRENGRLWYVTEVNGEKRKLPAEDVLHIKGLSYDGLVGYPVWEKARESLGLGLGARKYGAVYFKNSASLNIALEYPGNLGDKEVTTLRNTWERMHTGLDNVHRIGLLKGGMKLHQFGSNARDSQLLELRKFDILDVANFLNLPPHKLGDTTRTAYASVEQENLSYLSEGLDPWLVCWEEECWDKLLTEEEKAQDTHYVEFLREALLRTSLVDLGNFLRTALGGRPWMTLNEARGKMNLDPKPDGDEILEPLNMGKGGADNQPSDPAKGNAAVLAEAARDMALDAAQRCVRRIGHAADRAAEKPHAFLPWLEDLTAQHVGTVTEMLAPAVKAGNALTGGDLTAQDVAAYVLVGIRGGLLSLSGRCTPAKLAAEVAREFIEWERTMSAEVADIIMGKGTDDA